MVGALRRQLEKLPATFSSHLANPVCNEAFIGPRVIDWKRLYEFEMSDDNLLLPLLRQLSQYGNKCDRRSA